MYGGFRPGDKEPRRTALLAGSAFNILLPHIYNYLLGFDRCTNPSPKDFVCGDENVNPPETN